MNVLDASPVTASSPLEQERGAGTVGGAELEGGAVREVDGESAPAIDHVIAGWRSRPRSRR